jgi:glucokinase
MPGPVIGVDVGGTKIRGVVFEPERGAVLDRRQVPTPPGAGPLGDAVVDMVAGLAGRHPPAGIGVGVAGLVDRHGVLRYGPNLPGVVGLDLGPGLRSRFGVPVRVGNDATCAALGELRLGAARGARHAVVVTQGTGIGGGVVVDGRVLLGAHGFAGEPGHILVDPAGPRCACGAVGHWEAVASGTGLATLARQAVAAGVAPGLSARVGGRADALRGEHVLAAVADGDPGAVAVLDRFARWVAEGLGTLVAVLDPEVIVLGGGLVDASAHFLDRVRVALPAAVIGWEHRPEVPVVAAELGPEAGAIGAALLVLDRPDSPGARG